MEVVEASGMEYAVREGTAGIESGVSAGAAGVESEADWQVAMRRGPEAMRKSREELREDEGGLVEMLPVQVSEETHNL